MKQFRKLLNVSLLVIFFAGLAACSGLDDEQMQQLEDLRSEVSALEREVGLLRSEKSQLEIEIADKNAQLDECSRLKAETRRNLETLGL